LNIIYVSCLGNNYTIVIYVFYAHGWLFSACLYLCYNSLSFSHLVFTLVLFIQYFYFPFFCPPLGFVIQLTFSSSAQKCLIILSCFYFAVCIKPQHTDMPQETHFINMKYLYRCHFHNLFHIPTSRMKLSLFYRTLPLCLLYSAYFNVAM
jgi:hypothetical protein